KAAEKEKAAVLKAEQEQAEKERLEKARAEKEKLENERLEKQRQEKEKAEAAAREKAEKERSAKEKADKEKAEREREKAARDIKSRTRQSSQEPSPPPMRPDPVSQVPMLSKMPKKNKPATKPIKIPKEEEAISEAASPLPSTQSDGAQGSFGRSGNAASSNNSRAQSIDRIPMHDAPSLAQLFADIDQQCPWMHIADHPIFDVNKINPAAKMPLEYGPLVHALSALSVGGGSFANNMPSGSIDNAVSSFQQLLETLTQTISDLLRLLPRTTWDDSSSFDGVLRDMLKGDDFLDEGNEEG
ncbi:hypothetical protein OE88DRAFT_1613872, partial [Heliocybe sulcata]